MSVFNPMRLLIFLLTGLALFGFQIEKEADDHNKLRVTLTIPPAEFSNTFTFGDRTIEVPQISGAQWVHFTADNTLRPIISLGILLPPDGKLPTVTILGQKQATSNFSFPTLSGEEAEKYGVSEFSSPLQPDVYAQVTRAGQSAGRWYGNVIIQPLNIGHERLSEVRILLDFGDVQSNLASRSEGNIAALNSSMAANWVIPPPTRLHKPSDILQSGTWYKFPISETGVYRITRASLPADIPNISPVKWRVFAPYYMGKVLPQNLSGDGAVPPNLIEIGYRGTGLNDGVLAGEDNLRFFARGPNGDFNGDQILNPYVKEVYYWLLIPDDPNANSKSIPLSNADEGTVTNTINSYQEIFYHELDMTNPYRSGLTWLGEKFNGTSDQLSLNFEVSDQVLAGDFFVSTLFYPGIENTGSTDSHHITLAINQTTVRQFYASGTHSFGVTGSANCSLLNTGTNQIRITYQGNRSNSLVELDTLSLRYERYLTPKSDGILTAHVRLENGLNDLVFANLNSSYHFWDITDPSSPMEVIPQAGHFQKYGPGTLHLLGFADSDIKNVTATKVPNFVYQFRTADPGVNFIIITPEVFSQEAERIKDLHENRVPIEDRLTVRIAYLQDIYNEFAAGASDPTAIRNFLSYAYWNWQIRPEYVLFLGDADFDFRNITGQSKILVPVWETDGTNVGSLSEIATRSTDDYYVYLEGGAGDRAPDMAVGRLPARDPSSLTTMIDKIESYITKPVPGIWRNTAILVGDDPIRPNVGETAHIDQCERLCALLPKSFIAQKVYLTEYPDVQDPTSAYVRKPDAREDLLQKIYDGAVLITYMGHGSPTVWAQERVFTQSDLPRLNTNMKLPFWIAGTCDWGYFDDVNSNCVPEYILNMRDDGGIGVLTATRLVGSSSNEVLMLAVYNALFEYNDRGRSNTLGKAVQHAKAFGGSGAMNDEKYVLFADPAIRLASPRDKGTVTSILPDPLRALGKLNYVGNVQDSASLNGQAVVTAFDTKRNVTRHYSGYVPLYGAVYEGNISYELPGERIFRGLISVNSGQFSGQFTIPKDIRYVGHTGILNIQYWNYENQSGVAFVNNLVFASSDSADTDETGPDIQFYYFGQPLMNGHQILGGDNLTIELNDPNGINLAGVAGHGISLAIDEDWANAIDVTELFEYDVDRSDLGKLDVVLNDVDEGTHTVSVKAWDNYNNPNISNISLRFTNSNEFRIVDVYNYPNPMTQGTTFWFRLTDAADVNVSVYSLGGRKLRNLALGNRSRGYSTENWDGRDEYGQTLANGVYLYVVEAKPDLTSDPTQSIQKLVIAR